MKNFKTFEEFKKYCDKYQGKFLCGRCALKKGNACDYYFTEAKKLGGSYEEIQRRQFEMMQKASRKTLFKKSVIRKNKLLGE